MGIFLGPYKKKRENKTKKSKISITRIFPAKR